MAKKNIVLLLFITIIVVIAYFFIFPKGQQLRNLTNPPKKQDFSAEMMDEEAMSKRQIVIQNFSYVPKYFKAKVGDTITWLNKDNAAHTVTADNNAFDTDIIKIGDLAKLTFDKKGTYVYHCSLHPNMIGTIVVE